MDKPNQRVIAYIDGSNLYFGLKDAGLKFCKWLDGVEINKPIGW
jgi:hypothetical protein